MAHHQFYEAQKSLVFISLQNAINEDFLENAPLTTPSLQSLLPDNLQLVQTDAGLCLVGDNMTLRADFEHLTSRLAPSKLSQELLVRAARVKHTTTPLVIDATAGFGEDAFLLAANGCQVILFEHNPIVAALLRDALVRAESDSRLAPIVARMTLREEDSVHALRALEVKPDVVFLDPMFPQRTKRAAVKKKFQLIHQIEWPCSEENELFEAAMNCHPKKLVIKRALKGPYLANQKPHYSLEGKAIRYDCFAFAQN